MEPSFGVQLIGHMSYILLVSAVLVRAILPLRLLALAAGTTSIIYAVAIDSNVDLFWESVFTLVNAVQAVILIREQRGVRLTDEEESLHIAIFPHMSRLDYHRFIRAGEWHSEPPGVDLTVRGEPVHRLLLLSEGVADVVIDNAVIAHCRRGDFIGEIAFVSGNPATATVRTSSDTRYLAWKFADLRHLIQKNPDLRTSLRTVLSENLIGKLNEQRDPTDPDAGRQRGSVILYC